MNPAKSPVPITRRKRLLMLSAGFRELADVPPEFEWFRNLDNPHTVRAYRNAIWDPCSSPASNGPKSSA
jgi:hypothetical protein